MPDIAGLPSETVKRFAGVQTCVSTFLQFYAPFFNRALLFLSLGRFYRNAVNSVIIS